MVVARRSPMKAMLTGVFGAALLGAVFSKPLASRGVSSWIQSSLSKSCPSCKLKLKHFEFVSWFPLKVLVEGADFTDSPQSNPAVHFTLGRAEGQVSTLSLFQKGPTVESLRMGQLHVTVYEPEGSNPNSGPPFPKSCEALKGFPAMKVGKIEVRDSHFTYQHQVRKQRSEINVYKVHADVESFVTRPELQAPGVSARVKAKTYAQLEKTGKVMLSIQFDPFIEKNQDEIIIDIQGLRLGDLRPFFKIDGGVELEGVLRKGRATMNLSEGRLTGKMLASYRDLELFHHMTPDRGFIKNTLSNLVATITLTKTRPRKEEKGPPVVGISAQREPWEPITQLLIRGLKAAVEKIIQG